MQDIINLKDSILETIGELKVLVSVCVCVCVCVCEFVCVEGRGKCSWLQPRMKVILEAGSGLSPITSLSSNNNLLPPHHRNW